MITNYYIDTMEVYYPEPNKAVVKAKRLVTTVIRKAKDCEKRLDHYLNKRAYN